MARNLLHDFLHAANVQAQAVLGELFNYGIQADLTGIFTATDAKLGFELTGYMEEIDLVAVVDLAQFTAGNEPRLKTLMVYAGDVYSVRSLKTDQSAYVIGLKMIGPLAGAPGIVTQVFTVNLDIGDSSKTVTFPEAFLSTPRGVYVTLISPTGGSTFLLTVDGSSLDETGFAVLFGATVPATGYKLNVVALL